jgi:hypothetical protein
MRLTTYAYLFGFAGVFLLSGCLPLGQSGGSAGDEDADTSPDVAIEGTWGNGIPGTGTNMAFRVEGDEARLMAFGRDVTGRQYFDVGDVYLRNIRRTSASGWAAELARFNRVASPGTTDTTLYTKTSGSTNTGWTAVDNV